MMRLVYSELSRDDLLGILDYIAEHDPGAALRFVEGIKATCELLCTQPALGEQCDRIAPGLRRFTYRTYVIYFGYHPDEGLVRIRRVLHHARDEEQQAFGS